MKKIISYILIFLCISCAGWNGEDTALYWQISDDGSTVDGGNSVYTFLALEYNDDEIGVRIAAYDKYGNLVKYLNPIYHYQGEPSAEIDWEYNDQIIGTGGNILDTRASQAYYGRGDIEEMLFQMQIGRYDEDYNFYEFLYSNAEKLSSKNWYDFGTLSPPGTDWSPLSFYTINPVVPYSPEPNSGILISIGLSILMLKRKNC